jgi:hypothetical protein
VTESSVRTNGAAGRRASALEALGHEPFDLLVIGGGINGVGIARDAAMRGLRTALVERGDFACGTSSRSSKLIHGGLRYLEQGHVRLVLEAVRERERLRTLAPHLVRPQEFIVPIYRGGPVGFFKLAAGLRPAGEPVHGMWLRITVDRTLTIVDAAAAMDAMPYVDYCGAIVPAYRKLVGLAIRPGYHQRVKELLGGVRGCTHITELAGSLATAAFQTMAGQRIQDPDKRPFQLDRCHALAETAPAVGRYYPKWYRGKEKVDAEGEGEHH